MAFQRPENSGSQTVMENKVMSGIQMALPLEEEYYEFMGGIVNGVANYRNYKNSIGYSFRYYVTGMNKNDNIRLLSINGVEPSKENIKTEKVIIIIPNITLAAIISAFDAFSTETFLLTF